MRSRLSRLLAAVPVCLGLAWAAPSAAQSNVTVWVPDYFGGKVYKNYFDYTVSPVVDTKTTINVGSRGCPNPNGVALNGGLLYVVCNGDSGGTDEVLVYNAATKAFVKKITGLGTDHFQYFSGAGLIAGMFDALGNLWVSAYDSNQLLRIDPTHLAAGSPLVDREVIDSPDQPAGMALDPDKSIWIVGQYNGGILLKFAESDLNVGGTYLHTNPLNPTPRVCVSNNAPGCSHQTTLFNNPEGSPSSTTMSGWATTGAMPRPRRSSA